MLEITNQVVGTSAQNSGIKGFNKISTYRNQLPVSAAHASNWKLSFCYRKN